MKKLICLLIGLIVLTFAGCTEKIAGYEKTAIGFIKSQGYIVTSQKGEIQKYVLEKSKLYGGTETIPYQMVWGYKKSSLINTLEKK